MLSLSWLPAGILAHAFGQDFGLPLPLWLFVYGGVAAVVLSFVALGLMYDSRPRVSGPRRLFVVPVWLTYAVRIASGMAAWLVVAVGFFGPQQAAANLAVTYFWVLLLVGGVYLSVLFGNLWQYVNPFANAAIPLTWLIRKCRLPERMYPERLGYLPALGGFLVIIGLELVFRSVATIPWVTAALMTGYVLWLAVGNAIFGAAWVRRADFFSVFFSVIARMSCLTYADRTVHIRKPFGGLMVSSKQAAWLAPFVVFMLASTSFDGFTETAQFAWLKSGPLAWAGDTVAGIIAMLAVFGLLYGLFWSCVLLMGRVAQPRGHGMLAAFALSLVPIAVGYNIAHYVNFFIQTGQQAIVQVSDPFGRGWDLFGTAGWQPAVGIISPYVTWYVQVGAIIIGHVAAVYVAHRVAMKHFGSQSAVVASQLPMVILMVIYTTVSLWIIAQPVYIAQAQTRDADKRQRDFQEVLHPPAAPPPPPGPTR